MKQIYSLLLSLAFATTATAQTAPASVQPARFSAMQPASSLLPTAQSPVATMRPTSRHEVPACVGKRAFQDEPIIADTPEGTLYKDWYCGANGYYVVFNNVYMGFVDGMANSMVINGEDIYIQNPMALFTMTSWMKGKVDEDGNVTVTLPQKIYSQPEIDEWGNATGKMQDFYLWRMIVDDVEGVCNVDETTQEIKYKLTDGKLSRVVESPLIILGLADENGNWTGYGDYDYILTEVTEPKYAPNDPSDAFRCQVNYIEGDGRKDKIMTLDIEGDYVYFANMNKTMSDIWARGTIVGDKVVFEDMTYMGVDRELMAHMYFSAAEYIYQQSGIDVGFADRIEFDYDAANKKLQSDGMFIVNQGNSDCFARAKFNHPVITPYVEAEAAPQMPVIEYYEDQSVDNGFYYVQFATSRYTDDGKLLDDNNLYYTVYLSDKPYTFTKKKYPLIPEEMVDVPYGFSDGLNIYAPEDDRVILLIYGSRNSSFGIQSVYKNGDKEYRSDIATQALETGLNGITGDSDIRRVEYFDITGKPAVPSAKGLYVKRVTYGDGSCKTCKVLR